MSDEAPANQTEYREMPKEEEQSAADAQTESLRPKHSLSGWFTVSQTASAMALDTAPIAAWDWIGQSPSTTSVTTVS
jgi:hypothetical protein